VGLDDSALEARRHREAASLASVRTLSRRYGTSLSDVWQFLHTKHDLYAAAQLVARSSNNQKEEEAPAGEHVGAAAHDASTPSYGLLPNDAVIKSYGA
jgi:predicted nucleic acid-binding protein